MTLNRLSRGVRSRLDRVTRPGPQGPQGDVGPRGPAGADGPGARRIDFHADAIVSPDPVTVLDLGGFDIAVTCVLDSADVRLDIRITSSEDAVLQDTFSTDAGTDPGDPGTQSNAGTGNVQIPLSAGVTATLGLPPVSPPDYFRAIATVIVRTASRTTTLDLASIADDGARECSIMGTALPATA